MTQGVRFDYGTQHVRTRVPERRGSLAPGEVMYPRMLAARLFAPRRQFADRQR